MCDDQLDLTELDPSADPTEFARLLAQIEIAAEPYLAARRRLARSPSSWDVLVEWRRPILAAASMVLALAIGGIRIAQRPSGLRGVEPNASLVAAALGVPAGVNSWLAEPELAEYGPILQPLGGLR